MIEECYGDGGDGIAYQGCIEYLQLDVRHPVPNVNLFLDDILQGIRHSLRVLRVSVSVTTALESLKVLRLFVSNKNIWQCYPPREDVYVRIRHPNVSVRDLCMTPYLEVSRSLSLKLGCYVRFLLDGLGTWSLHLSDIWMALEHGRHVVWDEGIDGPKVVWAEGDDDVVLVSADGHGQSLLSAQED